MWGAVTAKNKQSLRAATLSEREGLSKTKAAAWSRRIQSKAIELPAYLACAIVGLYKPAGNEVATQNILEHALRWQKRVFYPGLGAKSEPEFIEVRTARELEGGRRFGVPAQSRAARLSDTARAQTVIFVPGVAFDARGHRLGRGRGWYDRAQAHYGKSVIFVALAYQFQMVDAVPTESWDQRVHYVITENRIYDCATEASQAKEVF